jgi:hypothetical protein
MNIIATRLIVLKCITSSDWAIFYGSRCWNEIGLEPANAKHA